MTATELAYLKVLFECGDKGKVMSFNGHLATLIRKGYVKDDFNTYTITPAGIALVAPPQTEMNLGDERRGGGKPF